jgi:hypothetical protein
MLYYSESLVCLGLGLVSANPGEIQIEVGVKLRLAASS